MYISFSKIKLLFCELIKKKCILSHMRITTTRKKFNIYCIKYFHSARVRVVKIKIFIFLCRVAGIIIFAKKKEKKSQAARCN